MNKDQGQTSVDAPRTQHAGSPVHTNAPESPKIKTVAEIEIGLANANDEIRRLRASEQTLKDQLAASQGDKVNLENKIKELNDGITTRALKIRELKEAMDEVKAGAMAASDLTIESLLAAARDRLLKFQGESLKCVENDRAIALIENAIQWLDRRTSLRRLQGVEGTQKTHRYMQ